MKKQTPSTTTSKPARQTKTSSASRKATTTSGAAHSHSRRDAEVEALLKDLSHPLKDEIETVRETMLNIDNNISEAIKWNTISFRTTDFFAAVHLRSTKSVQLVFHTGAKVKETAKTGVNISDPTGLCKWLAKDRCLLTLGVGDQMKANLPAFEALVREWIRWIEPS